MANRVNVNVNVNDNSRRALTALRARMQQARRDSGGNIRFNVVIPDDTTRRELRRIRRALRGEPVTIRTRLDPPTPPARTLRQRILRSLGRGVTVPVRLTTRGAVGAIRTPFRIMTRALGGLLSDGLGQSIVQAFQAAGPVGMAVLATLITAFISMLGAALAGLLVTTLGLAFISIGLLSAAKSEEVKDQWESTLDTLNEHFKTVGEPLVDTLLNGMDILERMAEKAAPILREAFAGAAPAIDTFFERIAQGFERFGEGAFDPIMDAWSTFSPVFGDIFSDFMGDLGSNFGDMARIVEEHSFEIEIALRAVFKIISGLVEVINFLAETWIFMFRLMNDAIAVVINYGLIPLAEAALNSMGIIIGAMENTIGKIPGFGDSLEGASEAFDAFRDNAMDQLRSVGENADQANNRLDKLNKIRKLRGDISQLQGKLKQAREDLKRTTSKKARAKVEANIKQLERELASARRQLNAIDGKTANTYVNTWHRNKGYAGNSVTGARAHGGVIGAAQTGGVRSNLTLVGEAGPELVRLPTGSNVRSNPDTRRLMKPQGAGAVASSLIFKSSGRRVDDLLLEILREAIHQRGGDPVKVLGG